MARPLSLVEALVGCFVLAASVATVACALLQLLADHEQQALVFGAGGAYLVVWSAIRLCVAPAR